jgi:ABC transporter DrrB family efflux protein
MRRGEVDLIIDRTEIGDPIQYVYDRANATGREGRVLANEQIQKATGATLTPTIDRALALPGGRYIDFLIPGLIAMSLLTTSLFGTGMVIVTNRREQLLKRFLVTPVRTGQYILSHILGRYMIMALELATVFLAGYLIFGFRVYGSVVLFVILCMIGTGAFTAMAMMFGARSKNAGAYNGMINLVALPMTLLSGIFFSRNHFPAWLQSLTDYLPLSALVDGLRSIALEGAPLRDLSFPLSVLGAYLLMASFLTRLRFRWY